MINNLLTQSDDVAALAEKVLPEIKEARTAEEVATMIEADESLVYSSFEYLAKTDQAERVGLNSPRIIPRIPEKKELWQWTPEYAKTQTFTGKLLTFLTSACSAPYNN